MLNNFKLTSLIDNIDPAHIPKKLNLVLEGGCMNGAYEIGGLLLIKELEHRGLTSISKISGASVGAYAGFLYLTNNLEKYADDYNLMKENFKKDLKLSYLKQQITVLVNNLSNKQFKSLQKDKLFITFYNVSTRQQQIISKYSSKKELINSILKSCHLPFLINGDCFYEEKDSNYMDGGVPYLFNEKETSLYMRLTQFDKIKSILNISYEKTIHGRILEGIIDTYNFFLKMKTTQMCSYTSNWNQYDKLYYKSTKTLYHLLIYLISIIHIFYKISKPILIKYEKTHFYKHFSPILIEFFKKLIIYLVFV